MSGTFNITELSGHRVLVTGDNSQRCVLDSSERDEMFAHFHKLAIGNAFESDVKRFFKPLTDAADAHTRRHEAIDAKFLGSDDPAFSLVLEDKVEGVAGKEEVKVVLGHDSVVLRLIEEGQTDRLVWVGDDRIEITKWVKPEPEEVELSNEELSSLQGFFNGLAATIGEQITTEDEPDQNTLLEDDGRHDS